MDLVFVLDSSESMIENDPWGKPYYHWDIFKKFTQDIVQNLPVGYDRTQVGFVQYSKSPQLVFPLNQHQTSINVQDAIKNNVNHLGGYTYTSEALRFIGSEAFSQAKGERHDARDVVVIISDGLSNYDYANTLLSAKQLKLSRPGLEIYTVGASKYVDEDELKGIASDPKDKYFLQLRDFKLMENYTQTMVHHLCNLPDPSLPGKYQQLYVIK